MPEKKKSTKSAGKSQNAKKSTTKSKSASAKNTSRNSSQRSAPQENSFIRQAAPYIIAVAAVLLAVCVIIGEGKIGGGIRNILTGLFAGAAYILPIFLLIRTFLWNRDAEEGQLTGRTSCLAIVFVLLAMFLHVVGGGQSTLNVKAHYTDGMELIGGGVFGGVLGELFMMGFGKVCTLILLVAAIVLLGLYVAGLTPRSIIIYIAYKIKFAGEKRQEKREVREERRRTAKPTKNQIREEEYLAYLREKKQREREARQSQKNVAQEPHGMPHTMSNTTQGGQIPLANPAATVYRVKRRRMTELDIPVDDITVPADNAEFAEATESDVQAELNNTYVDKNAVDEKIFDEVMRRTRERIEKSRKAEEIQADMPKTAVPEEIPAVRQQIESAELLKQAESTDKIELNVYETPSVENDFADENDAEPSEISAGDVLDAVEIAAMELHEKAKNQSGQTISEPVQQSKVKEDETDTIKLATSTDKSDEFDVTGIFVNPEDAELLDKLSEQYRQPLDVQRSTVSAPTQAPIKPQKPSIPPYQFPPTDILAEDEGGGNENIKEELQQNAVKLVDTLRSFNVRTKIENISRGPTITRYELLPEPGTKVRSIVNLVDDISLNLATMGVRIEAPIPGKSAVGIEVPNKKQSTVHLRTLIESKEFQEAKSPLTVCLGEDVAGEAVFFDVAKMPHLLIAGATGSGKSVCINSVITSLLYKASPEDVKLILIDPKKVELSIYNGIPHLLVPVVSEPKKAAGSLSWAVGEMERRYTLLEAVGVRDIKGFNEITKNDPDYEYMTRIVIIIDELADLMMTAPDDVEDSICRIAQKARAAGMHLIIGTQRPSVDVITGLIKANVPSRIAFRTSSQIDSRTIIDVGSAANLIGMGDMLFNPVGALKPRRVQGAYVSESDVEEVVAYIKNMNTAYSNFDSEKIVNEIEREAQKCGAAGGKKGSAASDDDDGDEDPMLKAAVELAIDSGKISTSLIQRRLSLGYGRAAKLIDRMEQLGYVSAPDGQKPREVLITKAEYMEMRLKDETPFDV